MRTFVFLTVILSGIFFITGGGSPAQEKKEPKAMKITVKSWDQQGRKFLNVAEVDAKKVEYKNSVWFLVPVKQAVGTDEPVKGSEITEPDGTVWIVTKGSSTGKGEFQAVVEKKPVMEKKP